MKAEFVQGLKDMGYTVEEPAADRVTFVYTIPVGRFEGKEVTLGFVVHDQFPATPPSGPHISPALLPLHPSQDIPHPLGGVHTSLFGEDWQYWSRPYPEWKAGQTVKDYMAHIRTLFQFP